MRISFVVSCAVHSHSSGRPMGIASRWHFNPDGNKICTRMRVNVMVYYILYCIRDNPFACVQANTPNPRLFYFFFLFSSRMEKTKSLLITICPWRNEYLCSVYIKVTNSFPVSVGIAHTLFRTHELDGTQNRLCTAHWNTVVGVGRIVPQFDWFTRTNMR